MSPRRTYDHRIREAIVASGDPNLFPELNIPPSTTRTWLKVGHRDVVGFSDDETALRIQLARLEKQLRVLREIVRLLLVWKQASGATLDHQRFSDGAKKKTPLRAIDRARTIMPLKAALKIVGLTRGRYHAWIDRAQRCELDADRAALVVAQAASAWMKYVGWVTSSPRLSIVTCRFGPSRCLLNAPDDSTPTR